MPSKDRAIKWTPERKQSVLTLIATANEIGVALGRQKPKLLKTYGDTLIAAADNVQQAFKPKRQPKNPLE